MKSNKGFSLVELIVVIAIMAIIAAVAVPVYSTYITKANEGVDENVFGEVVHAAEIAVVETDYSACTVTIAASEGTLTIAPAADADKALVVEIAGIVGATDEDKDGTYEIALKSTTFSGSKTVKGVNAK